MKHNKYEQANSAWIFGFWAKYNALPDALKEGFISLAESIKRDIEEEGKEEKVSKEE